MSEGEQNDYPIKLEMKSNCQRVAPDNTCGRETSEKLQQEQEALALKQEYPQYPAAGQTGYSYSNYGGAMHSGYRCQSGLESYTASPILAPLEGNRRLSSNVFEPLSPVAIGYGNRGGSAMSRGPGSDGYRVSPMEGYGERGDFKSIEVVHEGTSRKSKLSKEEKTNCEEFGRYISEMLKYLDIRRRNSVQKKIVDIIQEACSQS